MTPDEKDACAFLVLVAAGSLLGIACVGFVFWNLLLRLFS